MGNLALNESIFIFAKFKRHQQLSAIKATSSVINAKVLLVFNAENDVGLCFRDYTD